MKELEEDSDYRAAGARTLQNTVIGYYESSYWDYRTTWTGSSDLAIHYGYWDENTHSHSQSLLNMNREMANSIRAKSSDHILDAGTGIGGSALWLAQNCGAKVIGITLSTTQAKMASRHSKQRRLTDSVGFAVADMTLQPFPSESFDVVWCTESVCHVQDKSLFLNEAYRVLKPGGRLICADGYANKRSYTESEWRIIKICMDGWAIPNLAVADDFMAAMNQIGFSQISMRDVTPNIMPSSARLHRIAKFTSPLQQIMRAIGLRNSVQTGNFATALNQYYIFRDGLAVYGHIRGQKPE